MNRELKKLQNLYSWYEFYTKLGFYNEEQANKTQVQIEEQRKKVYKDA